MGDTAGSARLAGDRPVQTSPVLLGPIWLAGVLVAPLLVSGGAIGAAPFLGESRRRPSAPGRARCTSSQRSWRSACRCSGSC